MGEKILNFILALLVWMLIYLNIITIAGFALHYSMNLPVELGVTVIALHFLVTIYFIIHIVKINRELRGGKGMWILLLILFSYLAQPAYWYIHFYQQKPRWV